MKPFRLFIAPIGLCLVVAFNGCAAPQQLTAEEARIKYGNPYSQPSILDRAKKKQPPIPIDPALRDNGE